MDSEARKFVNISWTAAGVRVGMLPHQLDAKPPLDAAFRAALDQDWPGRAAALLPAEGEEGGQFPSDVASANL